MTYINHRFKNFCTIALSLICISPFVSAQEIDITKFTANPGIYDPITFGNSITLDACNSTFEDFSLCELNDLSRFELTWRVAPEGRDIFGQNTLAAIFSVGGSTINDTGSSSDTIIGNNFRDGVNFTINTGESSPFFPTPSRYTVQLGLLLRGGSADIELPDGSFIKPLARSTFIFNQTFVDLLPPVEIPPVVIGDPPPDSPPTTVPEPMGYLILIPAFYMIARRQRKLSQVKASLIA